MSASPKKAEPSGAKTAEKAGEELAAKPNNCLLCHGNKDVWEGDQLRLYVTEKDFHSDVHWGKGLRCANCHGGNPAAEQVNEAHAQEDGFRSLRLLRSDGTKDFRKPPDRAKVVELCGECHANIQFMKTSTRHPAWTNSANTGPAATANASRSRATPTWRPAFPATANPMEPAAIRARTGCSR